MQDLDKPLGSVCMSTPPIRVESVPESASPLPRVAAEIPIHSSLPQPELPAGAAVMLTQSFSTIQRGATRAFGEIHRYVQMGPRGVSVLCTFSALLTATDGAMNILRVTDAISGLFVYLLNVYLILFGVAMFLIEVDVQRLNQFSILKFASPLVSSWQSWIFQEVHIISGLKGRGAFYLFVGLLCLTSCSGSLLCVTFYVGLFNVLNGVLCIMSSMGAGSHTPSPAALHV